jgi:N-methylhydantoinase A
VAEKLAREGVEAVAVCFLFSFLRPRHEEIMGEYLRRRGLRCYLSSRVLPEYREYERAVTLAVNAYVAPVVEDYLKRLEEGLGDVRLEIMHSGGGTMSVREAGEIPARTLMSGPAGGVVAARQVAREAGRRRLITLDMGGTSTDVSIVEGDLVLTSEGEAAGFPLRFPMIDIHSIGAGGGSVARLDRGGALKVGPESAGADPGPACYGKSLLPTVTDANVVLGRLREEGFLGGRMRIFPQRSLKVMGELAGSLGCSVREAAWGVLSVVLANMAAAVRVMTVERGRDPSDYVLVAYGGAGPMHCCELAEMLGIEEVLVPPCPGTFSALGLLLADRVKDLSLTLLVDLDRQGMERARRVYRAMEEEVRKDEGLQDALLQPLFDLRYRGQSYELMLGGGDFGWDPGVLAEGFHREHERRYGYRVEEFPVELVNIRLRATLPSGVQPPRSDLSAMRVGAVGRVKVVFGKPGGDMEERDSLLLGRGDLQEGVDVEGPALILEEDSTVVVPPRWKVSVSTGGSLVLKRSG